MLGEKYNSNPDFGTHVEKGSSMLYNVCMTGRRGGVVRRRGAHDENLGALGISDVQQHRKAALVFGRVLRHAGNTKIVIVQA